MALVIVDRNKPESYRPIRLRDRLAEVVELAEFLQLQNSNATDQDILAVYGIPANDVVAYKNTINGLVTALADPAIENYLGNLG